jgi:CTP:molybdopterin cytidylyltransferase MocA
VIPTAENLDVDQPGDLAQVEQHLLAGISR